MNGRLSLFKNLINPSAVFKRNCSQLPEGIQYYGFTYYPRHKDFKDPPYKPSKLFLIRRLKSMKGRTPEERKALEKLQIDGEIKDKGHIAVVKNTEQINAVLWVIKHLIEIKPIIINGKLPEDGDFSGTFLRETGEFIISPKLKCNPEQIENSEKMLKDDKKLSRPYLTEYLRLKWEKAYSAYD